MRMAKANRARFKQSVRNNKVNKNDRHIDEEDDFPSEIVFKGTQE
jgi:hypothetical protein